MQISAYEGKSIDVDVYGVNICGDGPTSVYHNSAASESICNDGDSPVKGNSSNKEEEINYKTCSVYPNPANEDIIIELNANATDGSVYFYLYNELGQLIEKDLLTNTISTVPISGFAAGLYYYRVVNDNELCIKSDKLLIIH